MHHLFTTFKPKFTFKKLSEIEDQALFDKCVELVTLWFTDEWGYLHDKGKSDAEAIFGRVEHLLENSDKIQMAFYDKLIVGAFRIEDKKLEKLEKLDDELNEKIEKLTKGLNEEVGRLDKKLDEKLDKGEELKEPIKSNEIWFIYVDPSYRSLGAGRQMIQEIKRQSKDQMKDMILLDTLKPGLNRLYLAEGGKVVCENSLENNETTVIRIDL